MPKLEPWALQKWAWLGVFTVALLHLMAARLLRDAGVLHDAWWIQAAILTANVGFMFLVFGPLFEPAISKELGWGSPKKKPWKWQAVRLLALTGVLVFALVVGRHLGWMLEAATAR
jgi:hypothetical protein